jgi:glyoxylase-like metal-dependent hydrolase (beta-lactamase superfamily II)
MSPIPPTPTAAKAPTAIFDDVFALPPNRDTLGGSAYAIISPLGNVLVDAPAWHQLNYDFLTEIGGIATLFITHRGGIGQAAKIAAAMQCEVIIQEQEAYLLPELKPTTFGDRLTLGDPRLRAIWTPGHSPGSSCLYYDNHGGILFSGRHLLPDKDGRPVPLQVSKTFHWPRQLHHARVIRELYPAGLLRYICPGANAGLLRGKGAILVGEEIN